MSEENNSKDVSTPIVDDTSTKEVIDTSKVKKNKGKKIVIIIVLLLIAIGIGVGLYLKFGRKTESKTIKTENKKVYSKYRMSGNSLEDFDLSFLQLEANNQNLVYSPLSIKYALAMLSTGAQGETKKQIDAIIGDYKAKKYDNSPNMSFANAMFIKNTFKDNVLQSYTDGLKNDFNAEVVYDDFSSPDNVNSWINQKTLGLINNLVDDINDKDFLLINALAIDMEWNKLIQANSEHYKDIYSVSYSHENYHTGIDLIGDDQFNTVKFNNNSVNSKAGEIGASINNYDIVKTLGEDNIRATITQEYNAWLNSGDVCGNDEDTTTFVNRYINELNSNYKRIDTSTDFKFYNDNSVKVFSKELKEYNGTTLEYIGIMPKDKSLDQFIKGNNASSLSKIIDKRKTLELENFEEGKVTKIIGGIPFFKYDYDLKLMKDLQGLGVTNIFDSKKSNLSSLAKGGALIDDAKHKANIEFSNEGIKASAATVIGGLGSASCGFEHLYDVPVTVIDMTFDNPYLYVIRDKNSGEIWFVGTVYQPIENTNPNARIINEQ